MNRFAEVVERVSLLSTEELEEIKIIVDKQLSERRINEIEKALIESKKSLGSHTYFTSGEDILLSLNEE